MLRAGSYRAASSTVAGIVGSVASVHSCGNTAISDDQHDDTSETTKTGLRRSSRRASAQRLRGSLRLAGRGRAPVAVGWPVRTPIARWRRLVGSLIADPRVEHGVEQVDQQVGDQEHQRPAASRRRARLAVSPAADAPGTCRPPMPGMLKMPSVTIAPPIRAPRSMPMKVTTGISELRSACTPTTGLAAGPWPARCARSRSACSRSGWSGSAGR